MDKQAVMAAEATASLFDCWGRAGMAEPGGGGGGGGMFMVTVFFFWGQLKLQRARGRRTSMCSNSHVEAIIDDSTNSIYTWR